MTATEAPFDVRLAQATREKAARELMRSRLAVTAWCLFMGVTLALVTLTATLNAVGPIPVWLRVLVGLWLAATTVYLVGPWWKKDSRA